MFSDTARSLLEAIGKECSARGTFTQAEMLKAATALRQAFEVAEDPSSEESAASEEDRPVSMNRRAWPLIDMLERTAKGDAAANIIWRAAADF